MAVLFSIAAVKSYETADRTASPNSRGVVYHAFLSGQGYLVPGERSADTLSRGSVMSQLWLRLWTLPRDFATTLQLVSETTKKKKRKEKKVEDIVAHKCGGSVWPSGKAPGY